MGLDVLPAAGAQDGARARSPAAAQQRALQARASRGSPAQGRAAASGAVSAETEGMKARPLSPSFETCLVIHRPAA